MTYRKKLLATATPCLIWLVINIFIRVYKFSLINWIRVIKLFCQSQINGPGHCRSWKYIIMQSNIWIGINYFWIKYGYLSSHGNQTNILDQVFQEGFPTWTKNVYFVKCVLLENLDEISSLTTVVWFSFGHLRNDNDPEHQEQLVH